MHCFQEFGWIGGLICLDQFQVITDIPCKSRKLILEGIRQLIPHWDSRIVRYTCSSENNKISLSGCFLNVIYVRFQNTIIHTR